MRTVLLVLLFAVPAFGVGGTCPAGVPSGISSCFFVSAAGLDTNTGIDESHPWLHAPGMTNCASTCLSTTPVAGEGFILRGGDTWHFSGGGTPVGLPWTWSVSGSSSSASPGCTGSGCIYVGVDQTWFSGGSWTRPVMTGDNPLSTSPVASCSNTNSDFFSLNASFVVADNLEFTGMCYQGADGHGAASCASNCDDNQVGIGQSPGTENITAENFYIHGWTHKGFTCTFPGQLTGNCDVGEAMGTDSHTPGDINNLYSGLIVDGADSDPLSFACMVYGGFAIIQSVCRDTSQGFVTNNNQIFHDNLIEFLNEGSDPVKHANTYEMNANSGSIQFYNNVVRHIGLTNAIGVNLWFNPTGNAYIYNNVVYDIQTGANYFDVAGVGATWNLFNNTFQQPLSNSIIQNQSFTPTTWFSTNNHFINQNGTTVASVYAVTTNVTSSHDIIQLNSTANSQGYTAVQQYAPTNVSGATVGAGTNLTSSCGTNFVALCSDTTLACSYNSSNHTVSCPARTTIARPASVAWNSGAYQFISGHSGTSGSGGGQACSGGLPYPCARQDIATQNVIMPTTPVVNTVTVDPALGERIMRVSDNTVYPTNSTFACCQENNSAEVREIGVKSASLFSGDGGYIFPVQDTGKGYWFFCFDAVTMTSNLIHGSGGATSCGSITAQPNLMPSTNRWVAGQSVDTMSVSAPTVFYGSMNSQGQMFRYDLASGLYYNTNGTTSSSIVPYINFNNCTNIPSLTGTRFVTSVSGTVASGDTQFSADLGGSGQGASYIEAIVTQTGGVGGATTCLWYNTNTGQAGGDGMSTTTLSGGTLVTPGAVTGLAISGGTGATGTACVQVTTSSTYTNSSNVLIAGETLPTAEQCVTGATTGANVVFSFAGGWTNPAGLTVTGTGTPVCQTDTASNCRPYRVYLSTSSGTEQLQTSGGSCGSGVTTTANSCYPGGSFSLAYSSIVTGTASPPVSAAAGFAMHESHTANGGNGIAVLYEEQPVSVVFWNSNTETITACPAFTGGPYSCAGHATQGVNQFVNATVQLVSSCWPLWNRTFTTPLTFTQSNPNTPPCPDSDAHWSWVNSVNDKQPAMGVRYQGVGIAGGGSLDLNVNNCSLVPTAGSYGGYMNEMGLYSQNGTGLVYRAAQTRGTGGCSNPFATVGNPSLGYVIGDISFGHISQDGKFGIFGSPWGWQLGTDPHTLVNVAAFPGTVGTGTWQSNHLYGANACIYDGTNYQCTTAGGTSTNGSPPSWAATPGGTTTDNSVTWVMVPGCTNANNTGAWLQCRSDVFVVDLK